MKKSKKLFTFLLAAPLFLASCIMNNGICYTHVDNNKDGICDVCGTKVKVETNAVATTVARIISLLIRLFKFIKLL